MTPPDDLSEQGPRDEGPPRTSSRRPYGGSAVASGGSSSSGPDRRRATRGERQVGRAPGGDLRRQRRPGLEPIADLRRVGRGVDNSVVIVAGVAGLLAGAFSMAAGEYISVRVQREVYERLIHLEAHEIGSGSRGRAPGARRALRAQGPAEGPVGPARDRADEGPRGRARDPRPRGARARSARGPRVAVRGGGLVVRDVLAGRVRPAAAVPRVVGHTGGRRVGDPVRHRAVRRRRRDVVPHRPSLAAVRVADARRRRGRGRRHLPRRQGARRRGLS